jgi:hypothetical protein
MNPSDLALFRYSVIAPLLHVAPKTSLAELARGLAAEPKVRPDGRTIAISSESILRWLGRYRAAGLAGLEKSPRKDRGARRALGADVVDKLLSIADARPTWTVRMIHQEAEERLRRAISLKATYRLLPGHRRRSCPSDPARRREVLVPQTLWLADTMHGPYYVARPAA